MKWTFYENISFIRAIQGISELFSFGLLSQPQGTAAHTAAKGKVIHNLRACRQQRDPFAFAVSATNRPSNHTNQSFWTYCVIFWCSFCSIQINRKGGSRPPNQDTAVLVRDQWIREGILTTLRQFLPFPSSISPGSSFSIIPDAPLVWDTLPVELSGFCEVWTADIRLIRRVGNANSMRYVIYIDLIFWLLSWRTERYSIIWISTCIADSLRFCFKNYF